MNLDECYTVLNINKSELLELKTLEEKNDFIRKKYLIQALKYHPDKNNNTTTKEFQRISECYSKLINNSNTDKNDLFLNKIIQYFLGGKFNNADIEVSYDFIKKTLKDVEILIIQGVDTLPENDFRLLYNIFLKYRYIFNISKDICSFMEKKSIYWFSQGRMKDKLARENSLYNNIYPTSVEKDNEKDYWKAHDSEWNIEYFVEKEKKDKSDEENMTIVLKPTLKDLIQNNIFKYVRNNKNYIIPLWHTDLCFEEDNKIIEVKIEPKLPSNYWIDEKNNIHQKVHYSLCEIWNYVEENKHIEIYFGSKKLILYPEQLKLTKSQMWCWENDGISQINQNNILDISKKTDAIVHIHIMGLT